MEVVVVVEVPLVGEMHGEVHGRQARHVGSHPPDIKYHNSRAAAIITPIRPAMT